MKKKLSLVALSLLMLLTVSLVPSGPVGADGMVIELDPYYDRWDYSIENNQQAFINYADGLQKMIISVGLNQSSSKDAVWLFPVPANPDKIAIDTVEGLPSLRGQDISKKAKSNLDDISAFIQATQLYTIPFLATRGNSDSLKSDALSVSSDSGVSATPSDVTVYEHIDKNGITSEIVTTKTASGLYDYLKSKGLTVEDNSIPVLKEYIGKEYAFVVSWISVKGEVAAQEIKDNLNSYFSSYVYPRFDDLINELDDKYPDFGKIYYRNQKVAYLKSQEGAVVLQELTELIQDDPSIIEPVNRSSEDQKGVVVTFPTKDLYFPLMPTSVYGSKIVPATIRIIGHVSPEVFDSIKSYTKTEYYVDEQAYSSNSLKSFYSGKTENLKYTKITIEAPSKFFTDDLWIKNQAPIKTYHSAFIARYPLIVGAILFILISFVAGILAGLFVFKDLRKKPLKLGLFGLANCFSLVALSAVTVLAATKNENAYAEPLIAELKRKRYFWKRRLATLLFFIALPLLVIGVSALPSLVQSFGWYFRSGYHESSYLVTHIPIIAATILYVVPAVLLIASFFLQIIKIDDADLFVRLKSLNYSSWSFWPKDSRKYAFVPAFSVVFLVLTWITIKLIEISV